MKKQLDTVKHDYIRYANCWEDADVLLEALNVQEGDRVFSIGSAGDNSFSMLIGNPEKVVAVDINLTQLNLIELKKAAIKVFDHDTFLQFMGFREAENRINLFEKIKPQLSEEVQEFCKDHLMEIESGIIHTGKFERYFKLFHSKILPFIHSNKNINRLFEKKTIEQQRNFYSEIWNNKRWRFLFKIFFSKIIMGWFGRDPKFLKEVEIPVSEFILNKAEKQLSSDLCQENYFLQYILTGRFEMNIPHYARKENYDIIKSRIDRLEVFQGFAEEAFQKHSNFNKFNLSNIFEYMDYDTFDAVGRNLVQNASTSSRLAYWNLMVPRRLSKIFPELNYAEEQSKKLSEIDKGFFYNNINIDIKQ